LYGSTNPIEVELPRALTTFSPRHHPDFLLTMSDFTVVGGNMTFIPFVELQLGHVALSSNDVQQFEVYPAYIGFFQLHNIPWYVHHYLSMKTWNVTPLIGTTVHGDTSSHLSKNSSLFRGLSSPLRTHGPENHIL